MVSQMNVNQETILPVALLILKDGPYVLKTPLPSEQITITTFPSIPNSKCVFLVVERVLDLLQVQNLYLVDVLMYAPR